MDKLKQWVALSLLAALAVLAGGWFLLVSPKRSEAADLRTKADGQRQATSALKNQLAALKEQARNLPKEQAALARVAAKIPDDPAQPALLRSLAAAATDTGVEFLSVTPAPLVEVQPAAEATPTAKPSASSESSSEGSAGDSGSGTAKPKPSASPTAPAVGTLMAMPLTITVAGGYYEVEQYVAALEDLPRALRVQGLTIAPGTDPTSTAPASGPSATDGSTLVAVITGEVYVAADRAPEQPVVVPVATGAPAAPAPTPAATQTATAAAVPAPAASATPAQEQ